MRPVLMMPLLAVTILAIGCREGSRPAGAGPVASKDEGNAASEVQEALTKIINEADRKFSPLEYEYDEDLLQTLDRLDTYLTGPPDAKPPRAMPRMDEADEVAHLRETIRRWTAKTGKTLRPLIDPLKAEVAARKPGGPVFHPEFHKRFAAAFDDLIPVEVAELRERRNRTIHDRAKAVLDSHRATSPDLVRAQEKFLDTAPYNLPASP